MKFKILNVSIGGKILVIAAVVALALSVAVGLNIVPILEFLGSNSTLAILAVIIVLIPIALIVYSGYAKKKEIEENFPVFLRDFVESVRSGMSIPHSFQHVAKNDYKKLNPYIRRIAAQLDWGIPVSKVLMQFAKDTKSRVIGRIISSVIETHRFGGNLVNTFEALASTAVEVERLRAERMLYLQSQLMTGYIIFFVFLVVILGLEQFLVPSLTQVGPIATLGAATQAGLADEYKVIFRNLIIIQGLFAGLTVGKMAEGAMVAGIKHSLFMVFIGTLVFALFG